MLDRMLGADTRTVRITWTVVLVAALIVVVYQIRETLLVFTIAIFLAYVLSPAVKILEQHTPKRVPRTLALAIVYLAFVGAVVGFMVLLGSRIAEEASNLSQKIPALFNNPDWMKNLPLPGWLEPARARMMAFIRGEFANSGNLIAPYLRHLGSYAVATFQTALYVVLVPILSFMFLKDGEEMREFAVSGLTDPRNRDIADDILNDAHLLLGKYIRALLLLSVATFTAYSIFLEIIGAPYAILLAFVAAVLEWIPVIGPLTAGVAIILVAAFSGYGHVLWIVVFWAVYRLFQDYVLSPYLMGSGVEIHPLLVLFGVLAGEQLAGIPGMLFSVPVMAILRVIYVRDKRERQRRKLATAAEATLVVQQP